MEGDSDRQAMVRLAAGDRTALEPLMERHYRRLYRISLSYLRNPDDALDAVQETFVKAFRAAGRWDGSSEVGRWLTRIVVNESIDRFRRARRRRSAETPLETDGHELVLPDGGPSPERHVTGREIGERVAQALAVLPEKQRAIFVLRHVEELSLQEIAETLGLRLGTVKSALHRAVHHLRERLEGMRA